MKEIEKSYASGGLVDCDDNGINFDGGGTDGYYDG